jgi:glucuronate isomerase
MSKGLISENYLLQTDEAVALYNGYAREMPIIDYHCHLSPAEIAGDVRFDNLARIWLGGDHYKWRAMRANGVSERYCTGDAGDREKFDKWAETVPALLRNQLYSWTHLELARFFGISDCTLSPSTADRIWDECNAQLAGPEFSARSLMRQSNVVLVCTTDDPTDLLEYHSAIACDSSFDIKVYPTWRPDKAMAVENPADFKVWVEKLAEAADVDIKDYSSFMGAIRQRHGAFHGAGCRLSDHGIETIYAEECTDGEAASIFERVLAGKDPGADDVLKFKSAMLHEFAVMDFERKWVQQYHVGVLRNNNSRMYETLGPDTGFDSIGDADITRPLQKFLDRLNSEGKLAPTIVYNSNPRDNAALVTMLGCFQDDTVPGKMQFGSAWWFLDQKDGMERQLEDLSQTGLLSRFVGMTTDSRSFLSYPRHEYFRRILCDMLGREMHTGLLPNDEELVGCLVRSVCYDNAASYFGFDIA